MIRQSVSTLDEMKKKAIYSDIFVRMYISGLFLAGIPLAMGFGYFIPQLALLLFIGLPIISYFLKTNFEEKFEEQHRLEHRRNNRQKRKS